MIKKPKCEFAFRFLLDTRQFSFGNYRFQPRLDWGTEGRSTHHPGIIHTHVYVKRWRLSAEQLAVITICIKAIGAQGWRGRPSSYVSHRGGRKEVFARACSLITGGIAMRGTRFRKTWGARKSPASRVPAMPPPPPPFLSPAGLARARCFLIPWPNSEGRR